MQMKRKCSNWEGVNENLTSHIVAAEYNAIIYEINDFPAATGQIARRPLHIDMVLETMHERSEPEKNRNRKPCDS